MVGGGKDVGKTSLFNKSTNRTSGTIQFLPYFVHDNAVCVYVLPLFDFSFKIYVLKSFNCLLSSLFISLTGAW